MNKTVAALRKGLHVDYPDDEYRTPVHVALVAQAILKLADASHSGIFHLAGNDRLSRYHLVCRIAAKLQVEENRIVIKNAEQLAGRATRAKDVSLANDKASQALNMNFLTADQALQDIFANEPPPS
jgi:dTDP-4-dehydrorhamnose reductase